MKYNKSILLKNGKTLLLRNGEEADGACLLKVFNDAHAETDYLLSYPEESTHGIEEEAEFLKMKTESPNEIEILAFVDGMVVGSAGIESMGSKYKVRHRSEIGISVLKEFWGMGIGRLLMEACIECAKEAGYKQIELTVVAENERAIGLYERLGFQEYGRNPMGFNSKFTGYQEIVLMRMEL